ncbi:hypothetical protein [Nocardia salmonicida]
MSALQALLARQMYDETDERGKHRYTVVQIAETSVVTQTIYRHLERSA